MKFQIYKDKKSEWRWRLRASNGEIVAAGESYTRQADCKRAVSMLKKQAVFASVELIRDGRAASDITEESVIC